MNPFFWADEKLITQVFEPIAWRIQHKNGQDNFDLAKIANDVSSIALFVGNLALSYSLRDVTMSILGSFAAWNVWDGGREAIKNAAKSARKHPEMLNPRKGSGMQILRILLFWLFIPFLGILFGNAGNNAGTWTLSIVFIVGQFMQGYFTSCNPMPPGWCVPKEEKAPDALPQLG